MHPILWFLALMYVLLAWVFLQSDRLVGIYRWIFSLAVVPVFLFLMFANIWIADHLFPDIIEWHKVEWYKASQSLFTGLLDTRIQTLVAFLMTSFLPIAFCSGWYWIFVRLSLRSPKASNRVFKRRVGKSKA
jgi:hypothetical protein